TVVVEAGEIIPGAGDVIQGIASVDESAITGESAPVIRESGGDRSAVTGGTKVLSDRIVVRITASPGESFLDRMIALVEGAERQKTPNEIALTVLLAETGTITLGNRMATEFIAVDGVSPEALADAAQLASLADETPEGRSIVVLAKDKYGLRGRDVQAIGAKFIPFSAQTRMSGCDLDGRTIRKGAVDAIVSFVGEMGGTVSSQIEGVTHGI